MPTLTLEVTIRMSVDKDLYDGMDDGGICHLAVMDTNEIRNRPWDAVHVRVAEPECHCWHHQALRDAMCEGGERE